MAEIVASKDCRVQRMNTIDDLRRNLSLAEARAEKDPSDLRHSNPGRLKRDAAERLDAQVQASQLRKAIEVATTLDAENIPWIIDKDWIHFLLPSGETYPAAGKYANAVDHCSDVAAQIEAIKASSSVDIRQQLALMDLSVGASRDLKWIRDRMAGVSAPKFRKGFLVEAGLLADRGDYLEITPVAHDNQILTEHEGEFGPWHRATALGTTWIYRSYLCGHVPMTKAARSGPISQFELEAIANTQADNLLTLPDPLRRYCGQI